MTSMRRSPKQPTTRPAWVEYQILQSPEQPTTWPAWGEYEILQYLSFSELLTICAVAKKWHENGMAMFWGRVEKCRFSGVGLYRALINVVTCQNAYSISRIDTLVKAGAMLNTRYLGRRTHVIHYVYTGDKDTKKQQITFSDPTPLKVAAVLAEKKGSYGAAIVKHLVSRKNEESKVKTTLPRKMSDVFIQLPRVELAYLIGCKYESYGDRITSNVLLCAFLKQQHAQLEYEEERRRFYGHLHVMSKTEKITKGICMGFGFGVPGVLAMVLCALLAPSITVNIIIPIMIVSSVFSLSSSGCEDTTMEVVGLGVLISSLAVVCSGLITLMLTSALSPFVCGIGLATVALIAGLYITADSMMQSHDRDAERFKNIAQSAKCRPEPQYMTYGGLFNTMWQKMSRKTSYAAVAVSVESHEQTTPALLVS